MEAMALSRDRHTMCHSEETTAKFSDKLCESLELVSQLIYYYFMSLVFPCFCLMFYCKQAATFGHGLMMKDQRDK